MYFSRTKPHHLPTAREGLNLLHHLFKRGIRRADGAFECMLSRLPVNDFSSLNSFLPNEIVFSISNRVQDGKEEVILSFHRCSAASAMKRNEVLQFFDLRYPDEKYLQYTLTPLPPKTQEVIAPLLVKMMESGQDIEPSGYFRCVYASRDENNLVQSRRIFSHDEADCIVQALSSAGIFCTAIDAFMFKDNPNDTDFYLSFNKSKADLHDLLDEICPGYQEQGRERKNCYIL